MLKFIGSGVASSWGINSLGIASLSAFILLAPAKGALALDKCRDYLEMRTRIPIWRPEVQNEATVSAAPPQGDGLIIYIDLYGDNQTQQCSGAKKDKVYTFTKMNNPARGSIEGGLDIILKGNVQFANGTCYFRGYYINEPVMGMWQGFVATRFNAVSRTTIAVSGRFCIDGDIE